MSLSTYFENLRFLENLFFKYIDPLQTFNETLYETYKTIFSDKISNNLINLLNLQSNLNNSKMFILIYIFYIFLKEICLKYFLNQH